MARNQVGQTALEVYEMLKAGKKVTTVAEKVINHKEDWNDPHESGWSSNKTRMTPILYFWCNPQMNRMMGKLADGRQVDININLLDLAYYTFMEYIEEPKPTSWRDVFDAKKVHPMNWANARSKAKELNYPYICWNGRVYATRDSYQAFPICLEEEL